MGIVMALRGPRLGKLCALAAVERTLGKRDPQQEMATPARQDEAIKQGRKGLGVGIRGLRADSV